MIPIDSFLIKLIYISWRRMSEFISYSLTYNKPNKCSDNYCENSILDEVVAHHTCNYCDKKFCAKCIIIFEIIEKSCKYKKFCCGNCCDWYEN